MGSGRWSPDDWTSYTSSSGYSSKTVDAIYTSSDIDPDFDPRKIKIRESRDSKDNPNSNAVIVALDVTGSMSPVLDSVAKKGLNTLVTDIHRLKPVSDPHVMFMAIGDVEAGDRAPLQATQFEADLRIAKQLEKLYLEGGGGGNSYESYALAWYFAATKTSIDCYEKRGKKGYIFTVGDEEPTPYLRGQDIEKVFGTKPQFDRIGVDEVLTMASRQWEIFHLILAEGSHASNYPNEVRKAWTAKLGQRALWVTDHTKLAEVVVATIALNEGASADKVVSSFSGATALVVKKATEELARKGSGGGIAKL